ncbi:uncharacterized protein LOC124343166 isoform X2 [Daphnia pulicaria]|uniref:uncharacterized protein LOC124343166 isoform X2 n=1 Tax=Daphnia pulicaria TaxID=35523 RepID=UPI001EECCEBA|nr:uncharacterized protein LOC124343166 isoform X2 [Daphnia pulicaria]
MNCQLPHNIWRSRTFERKGYHDRDATNEDQFNFDSYITCPRISFLENGLLRNNTVENWPDLMDLDEHITLPTPLLPPNASVKCGRDPVVRSVNKKDELNHFLFKETLAHECRLLIRNSKGEINLSTLKNNWKKFIKRTEIPEPERNLVTIMDRYGCDEPPTETYAGGNLAIVWLENERYLVHSAMEPFDCQMYLTRMTADDMKNHPLESVSTKTPFNDGTVYQIAVPRQSGCWDPSFQQQNDPLFATRQFHTTRLWKVEQRETGSLPIITNVQECSDPSSIVRYVEFNQFDCGEFCELRSQEIKISERGLLKYQKAVYKKYDSCMYVNHKILLFSSSRTLDLLDVRCRNTENIEPIFSIDDQGMRLFYNMPPLETIVSCSASSRDNVYLISTGKSLLVWDIRCGSRLLHRAEHLLESPPDWISTVQLGPDKDWIFLDSQNPASSGMVGLSWNNQENCLDLMNDLPVVSVEFEPRIRWSVLDTFGAIQQRGLGLDWSIQNRFKQMRSGIACDKDSDGTIQIWQCTVAGDLFSQQLNPSKRIGPSQQKATHLFFTQLSDWTEAVEQIEELNASLSQNLFDQTEECDAEKLKDNIQKTSEEVEEENFGSFHMPAIFNHKYTSMPDVLEMDCPEDKTRNIDGQGAGLNKEWIEERNPGPCSQNFLSDDTFALDFQDDLISSTPFQPMQKTHGAAPLPGFLISSTPAIRAVKPNCFPSPKRNLTSTPFRHQTPQTWNAPSQYQAPQNWDAPSQHQTPQNWNAPSQHQTPQNWNAPSQHQTPQNWNAPSQRKSVKRTQEWDF